MAVLLESSTLTAMAGAGAIVSAGILGYTLWFALSIEPPEAPEMPDFNDFFKDMEKPGKPKSSLDQG